MSMRHCREDMNCLQRVDSEFSRFINFSLGNVILKFDFKIDWRKLYSHIEWWTSLKLYHEKKFASDSFISHNIKTLWNWSRASSIEIVKSAFNHIHKVWIKWFGFIICWRMNQNWKTKVENQSWKTIVLVGGFPDFDASPLIMKNNLLGIRYTNHSTRF